MTTEIDEALAHIRTLLELARDAPVGSGEALMNIMRVHRAVTVLTAPHIYAAFLRDKKPKYTVAEFRLYNQSVLRFVADCFVRNLSLPATGDSISPETATPMSAVVHSTIDALEGMARGRVENPIFLADKGKKPKVSDEVMTMRATIVAAAYSLKDGCTDMERITELEELGWNESTVRKWKTDIDNRRGSIADIAEMRVDKEYAKIILKKYEIKNGQLVRHSTV
jgi:hypothetical protein